MGKERGKDMISPADEAYALDKAYVPEHIVSLMAAISEAEAFLIEDHLSFAKDNWLIVVGYPLDRKFSQDRCEKIVKLNLERFRPEVLWFIGPQVPTSLSDSCTERESDQYYQLDLDQIRVKTSLRNAAEKAGRTLSVERAKVFSRENEKLVSELLEREKMPPRIKGLYQAMPRYVAHSASAWVLNAWDQRKRLSAFIVVELAAKHFVTYVLGSHSKKHYVPHASDLLFLEMINLTRECGKNTIHLGLGVNEGIRRFKEKWGGVPYLNYEFCEVSREPARAVSLVRKLLGRL
jgi:hypothetical protein